MDSKLTHRHNIVIDYDIHPDSYLQLDSSKDDPKS